jgi:ribosome-associated protein
MQDDDPYHERPSKSAAKREAQGLQDLGEALIGLPDEQLDALPLPERLRDAVLAARRITSHGARLRQHQFIGKLMRKVDVEPIRAAIEAQQEAQRTQARRFKRIETWRDRVIREGEPALAELCAAHPAADAAELRRLAADARAEAEQQRPPRAARELFQRLRDLLESPTLPQ